MEVEDILALNVSLVNLAIKCYIEEIDYVDKAFEYCRGILEKKDVTMLDHVIVACLICAILYVLYNRVTNNSPSGRELQRLLKVPIDGYEDNILTVLNLQQYSTLVKFLDFNGRKDLSLYLLNAVLEKDASVTSQSEVLHECKWNGSQLIYIVLG